MERVENSVGAGRPDVDGCINGGDFYIELKSEMRPKRIGTPIHPKLRPSQSIWHRERCEAGCRINWILMQVGEAAEARLYLIPGKFYDQLASLAEVELKTLSVVPPEASPSDVLIRVETPW